MRCFRIDNDAPLSCAACGNLLSDAHFLHHKRSFPYHVFILVLEGTLYITNQGTEYAVERDQYIVLPANELHLGHKATEGKLRYMWAHFTAEATLSKTRAVRESGYCFLEYGKIDSSKRVQLLFSRLLDLARQENLYTTRMLDYAMSLTLMALTQEHIDGFGSADKCIPPQLQHVMAFARSNAHQRLSALDVAKTFGYSKGHLSLMFKTHLGCTLHQFIMDARIDTAKQLLSSNDVSIKEAAYSCGFLDEKYFMRLFKKQVGMPPVGL